MLRLGPVMLHHVPIVSSAKGGGYVFDIVSWSVTALSRHACSCQSKRMNADVVVFKQGEVFMVFLGRT